MLRYIYTYIFLFLLFQLNLDVIWTVIFGVPASRPVFMANKESKIEICLEASMVILSMVRSMLNEVRMKQSARGYHYDS